MSSVFCFKARQLLRGWHVQFIRPRIWFMEARASASQPLE
jgi:hypothetical protein